MAMAAAVQAIAQGPRWGPHRGLCAHARPVAAAAPVA